MGDNGQSVLFEMQPAWAQVWSGMPEFHQDDLTPHKSVIVHFRNDADRLRFADLIGQPITPKTQSVWHPQLEISHYHGVRKWVGGTKDTRYPIYVISKGRWATRSTAKALERIGVSYRIVVEPQEFDSYAAVIDPSKILTLPFSNLGEGSIPARNWVFEHSIVEGHHKHWILDDNISNFFRLKDNDLTPVASAVPFAAVEDLTDRYENIRLSGLNYVGLAKRKEQVPPFYLNTRIYSCILIDNSIPHRWRGRYNEDTDLCLRVLKDGDCTLLVNAFQADKTTTMRMRGGNSDELYKDDGRLLMAESLVKQHPDVARVSEKWGRYQHHVDYSGFKKNKLKPKCGSIPVEPNNYGMTLETKIPTGRSGT